MKNVKSNSRGSGVYATRRSARCQEKQQRMTRYTCGDGHKGTKTRAAAMVGYAHHQVVRSELLLPLETFRDSKHLTTIMYDIAKALEHIHGVGAFHRNISISNIMVDTEGNGRLVDFDLGRRTTEEGARRSMRTGTWQFISTAQLRNPEKVYEVSDELESLFFVMLYEGIHWVVHNKPTALNAAYIFDAVAADFSSHRTTGGRGKFCMYTLSPHTDMMLNQLRFEQSPPFADLLRELFHLFRSLAVVNRNKKSGEELQGEDLSNVKKLENCRAVVRLMEDAVERVDWPEEHDKARSDNYPRDRRFHCGLTGYAT